MNRIFIEAESFSNKGGWVVDQQSINNMGSAYLMAHGMGTPVPDATTFIKVPKSGTWYAFVRTRDWTAVWKRGNPAGIFKLKVNDIYFQNTLGNNGENWDWQFAGKLKLKEGRVLLSLCDLTGFNGRCDAVFLTTDPNDIPKNTEDFRREVADITVTDDPKEYDLVICGGGIAGTCMALAALREGIRVVLINNRPVLGGCNSSEIKIGMGGWAHAEPYPNVGNILDQISPVFSAPGSYSAEFYEDSRKINAFLTLPKYCRGNYTLSLNEHVIDIEKDKDRITAVITKNIYNGQLKRYRGTLFADCTGDAVLARKGGAEVMYGREAKEEFGEELAPEKADNMVMGMTITWYSENNDTEQSFPDIDWGIEFDDDHCYPVNSGDWEWEVGQFRNMADETEYIRDYSLMTIFGNWSFIKNHYKNKNKFRNRSLAWVSPYGGKRESYRVKGDLILTENDIEQHIPHNDETASLTWDIDIHYPEPDNMRKFKEPFRSCAIHRGIVKHYPVPYRCLYSKDIVNLFLGGRIVSATHIAFACVRVMRTLGALGEVAGLAAGICIREKCNPRDVYTSHLEKLKALMVRGIEIKPMHAYAPGEDEHLAFKECNTFFTYPVVSLPLDDKEWMWKINNSGIPFHDWQKWRGIEDKNELTAEENEIAQRFKRGKKFK